VSFAARSSSLGRFASSEDCDRCGRSWLRCRNTFLTSQRLAALRMIHRPVTGLPVGLGTRSGSRTAARDFTPVWSRNGVIATRVRLGVIGCAGGCGLNQSTGQLAIAGGPCTTGPIITTDASGVFAHSRTARSFDRAPLMRFCPLQHSLAALRCVGLPASTQSRFGVSSRPPAHLRTLGSHARPCGLSQDGVCRGDARVMDEPA